MPRYSLAGNLDVESESDRSYHSVAALALRAAVAAKDFNRMLSILATVEEHPNQSTKPYIAVVQALCQGSRMKGALKIIDRMHSRSLHDASIYYSVVNCCGSDISVLLTLLRSKCDPRSVDISLVNHTLRHILKNLNTGSEDVLEIHKKVIELVMHLCERATLPSAITFKLLASSKWCTTEDQIEQLVLLATKNAGHIRNTGASDNIAQTLLSAYFRVAPEQTQTILNFFSRLHKSLFPKFEAPISKFSSLPLQQPKRIVRAHQNKVCLLTTTPLRQKISPSFQASTFNALIIGLARSGCLRGATMVWSDMKVMWYTPSQESLVHVMRASARSDQENLFWHTWKEVVQSVASKSSPQRSAASETNPFIFLSRKVDLFRPIMHLAQALTASKKFDTLLLKLCVGTVSISIERSSIPDNQRLEENL